MQGKFFEDRVFLVQIEFVYNESILRDGDCYLRSDFKQFPDEFKGAV